jgi:hypothetical protein
MEHIEAAGRFQLRNGHGRALVAAVRRAIRARLAARHPAWLELVPAELHERLAERSGLSEERVSRALAYGDSHDRERLARRIATLERIRKAL